MIAATPAQSSPPSGLTGMGGAGRNRRR